MTHREETLIRILDRSGVQVDRYRDGTPTHYVFHLNDRQVGNPARGIAEAELLAYAIRDYARITTQLTGPPAAITDRTGI